MEPSGFGTVAVKNRLQQKVIAGRPTNTRVMLKSSSGHLGIGRGLVNSHLDSAREIQSSTLKAPVTGLVADSPEKSPSKELFRLPAPRPDEQQLHLM